MMIKDQLGDYQLIKKLGVGSMGETFLAEHRMMKRPFVIKILPTELTYDPEFIQRFESDIHALSAIEHPAIAKIHNAAYAEGVFYLVTDAISDGESINLKTYLEENAQLSEEELLRIVRPIASALDFAHQKGVAHGSLRLSNILIHDDKVALTDFGLSKIIGPLAMMSRTIYSVAATSNIGIKFEEDGSDHYSSGPYDTKKASELHRSFFEAFSFLSPEQKTGNHGCPVDAYAFGVLLYFLLTKEFPQGYFELPSKQRPDLKWNWDLLICKCLQTDPLKRPENLTQKLDEMINTTSLSSTRSQLQKLKAVIAPEGPAKPVLKPQELNRPSFEPDPGAIFKVDLTVAPYKPTQDEEKTIQPLLTEMSVIPGGTYLRGSNHGGRDEMPRHAVNLNSFAIDIHPVTNEQFVLFLEAMGGEKDSNNNDIIRLRESRVKRSGGKINIEAGYAKHPVVGVTWYGAVAYAKWVGKRLPTEAEWEVAAYGGREDFLYPTGNVIERSQANFFSSDTTPVLSYPANGYELFDVVGNVYEWCQDWYDYHYYSHSVQEPDNPKGPLQGVYRVLRGGCWKSLKDDMRCAHRHRNNPGLMNGTYGFRCAADVE